MNTSSACPRQKSKSKKDNHFKKAEHPAYLLRNSLVSPTLLSGIWNAKYVNAVPLYRQEQEFQRMGLKKCLSPAKKYKLYKSSINKSIHFVQRSLSSSTRG